MSLFKTLQNAPATISIFHNKKIPNSTLLYSILDKASAKINADKEKFQVDVMINKMPTYDQFSFIINSCLKDDKSKSFLKNAFPLVSPKQSSGGEKSRITQIPPIQLQGKNWKTFSEGEYAIVYEAFQSLVDDLEAHPEHDPSEIFKAPLLVDWDQSLIAGDESSLEEILAKYK
ncbi:hypothetical protein CLIB1423_20S01992 [[Candida] railenensis]|uniref:Uncharacterized protein n=1 Tax=[Candida] railenensis TaxID=45579 RepID=A0A9P0W0G3_9ASCO|nr:hypothetical protein CLIB1423_20S01992 [[Candida] railenensis]